MNQFTRKRLLAQFGKFYKVFRPKDGMFVCFYCGAPAYELDHQPPISQIETRPDVDRQYLDIVKVPCCRECNGILSNKITESLIDRFYLCKTLLRNKYKKIIGQPAWEDNELQQLAGNLKRYVGVTKNKQLAILARIGYENGLKDWIEEHS